MNAQATRIENGQDIEKHELDKRLGTISWAVFLIMIGGIGLVPKGLMPGGTWLIGVGLILLGLNVTRYLYGIKMRLFSILLGLVALIAGLGNLSGVDLPILSILLIVIGADLILKPWFEKRTRGA